MTSILAALKLLLSKDARETAQRVAERYGGDAGEVAKHLRTHVASVSLDTRERVELFSHRMRSDMEEFKFDADAVTAALECLNELVDNGLAHALQKRRKLRVRAEVCPVYAAVSVTNPRGVAYDLERFLRKAADHMLETELQGRGRGLFLVQRLADSIDQVGDRSVKATVFARRVVIECVHARGVEVIYVASGLSNPSMGRRVLDVIRTVECREILLCIDPSECALEFGELVDDLTQPRARDRRPSSVQLYDIVSSARIFGKKLRIVGGQGVLEELFPKDVVFRTVELALGRIRELRDRADDS